MSAGGRAGGRAGEPRTGGGGGGGSSGLREPSQPGRERAREQEGGRTRLVAGAGGLRGEGGGVGARKNGEGKRSPTNTTTHTQRRSEPLCGAPPSAGSAGSRPCPQGPRERGRWRRITRGQRQPEEAEAAAAAAATTPARAAAAAAAAPGAARGNRGAKGSGGGGGGRGAASDASRRIAAARLGSPSHSIKCRRGTAGLSAPEEGGGGGGGGDDHLLLHHHHHHHEAEAEGEPPKARASSSPPLRQGRRGTTERDTQREGRAPARAQAHTHTPHTSLTTRPTSGRGRPTEREGGRRGRPGNGGRRGGGSRASRGKRSRRRRRRRRPAAGGAKELRFLPAQTMFSGYILKRRISTNAAFRVQDL
ncbi:uncharacterized protein LOC144587144 [Pogona vitticeps]